MKIKNAILAAFAFTFAMSSALATMFIPENVYVRAKLSAAGAARCIQTSAQCDNSGFSICTIVLATTGAGVQVATTNGSSLGGFIAYRVGCLVPLFNSNNNILVATPSQSVYTLTTEQP
jgi:hypothetical protein